MKHPFIKICLFSLAIILCSLGVSGTISSSFAQTQSLINNASAPVTSLAHSDQSTLLAEYLNPTWVNGLWGRFIGRTGLFVLDLDGDGQQEILYGGQSSWVVVSYNPAYSTYNFKYTSPPSSSEITQITPGRPTPSSSLCIYVAYFDGTVEVYDAKTHQQLKVLTIENDRVTGMAVADIDVDGANELVLKTSEKILRILDAQTYQLKWSENLPTDMTGSNLTVGNVDLDPALEIIFMNTVVDGITGEVEWIRNDIFTEGIQSVADVDSDGRQEILWLEGNDPSFVSAYDAETKSLNWKMPIYEKVNTFYVSLYTGDYDQDGIVEIAVGDGNSDGIFIYNSQNLQFERKIASSTNENIFGSIAFGDVDQDGVIEVVSGTGSSFNMYTTGTHYLYIGNTLTNQYEWHSYPYEGPFSISDVGDVDDDGNNEIVMVPNRGYFVYIFDANTLILKRELALPFNYTVGVKLVDIDGDGVKEIAALDPLTVVAIDGITGETVWRNDAPVLEFYKAFDFADIDLDGKREFLTMQEYYQGSQKTIFLNATNLATNTQEWSVNWPSNLGLPQDLIACNVDTDENLEVIAATLDGFYVYDGLTHEQDWTNTDTAFTALQCGDTDGDGVQEILAGTQAGTVKVYDAKNKTEKGSYQVSIDNQAIYSLRLVDFNDDGMLELVVSDPARLYVVSTVTWKTLWKSPILGSDTGLGNHLVVSDLNQDGKQEILIGSTQLLYQFQHNSQAPGNFKPAVLSILPNTDNPLSESQPFIVSFNEPVLPESVGVSCLPEVTNWKAYLNGTQEIRLDHDPFTSESDFYCKITAAEDNFGFTSTDLYSWSFSTKTKIGFDQFLPSTYH